MKPKNTSERYEYFNQYQCLMESNKNHIVKIELLKSKKVIRQCI